MILDGSEEGFVVELRWGGGVVSNGSEEGHGIECKRGS